MKNFTTLLLLLLVIEGFGQQRTCGSMENLAEQLEQDPEMRERMAKQERYTKEYQRGQRSLSSVITIPVVFHIIHDGDAVGVDENISDALILAQLDQMNDDFALMNSDAGMIPAMFSGLAANTMIQFCLAERTPDCQATTGIERINLGQASWSKADVNSIVKPGTIWDRDQYLNIWTVRFGAPNEGLLGFGQFPGGTANTDGVVNAFYTTGSLAMPNPHPDGFGVYNKGRTMTHEVGHWLNLKHIWGDAICGDDSVADTPIHNDENGGCPTHPKTNTCSGTITEMFMNYMDYVNDDCMHMFSQGQSDRMCAVLDGGDRSSLAASEGCIAPGVCYCAAASDDYAANEKIGNITFADIDNTSTSDNPYENFRLVQGEVEKEESYTFTATLTNGFSTDQVLVWIDYNNNGDFDDAGELVYTSSTGSGPHSTTITIPATAMLGETRMRVRLHDTSLDPNATSCGNSGYGQVEDYTLNIIAALPVDFLSFTVKATEASVAQLNWQTTAEFNNKGFEVEMAREEAARFTKLGFVPANEAHVYQYKSVTLAAGRYYFRLRQVDHDGQFTYSSIQSLVIEKGSQGFSLAPNPVKDLLNLQVVTVLTEDATVEILQPTGQVIQMATLSAGSSTLTLSVNHLPTGSYILRINANGHLEYVRFIVQ